MVQDESFDAAKELIAVWAALESKVTTWERALALAGSPQLAQKATPASCRKLADSLEYAAQNANDPVRFAALVGIHARTLAYYNRMQESLFLYNALEPIFVEHASAVDVAAHRMDRANALTQIGRYHEALAEYDRAESIFAQHGLEVDMAICQAVRANSLQKMRRYQEALAGYDKAETNLTRHGLEVNVAICQMNRANLLLEMDRYQEALAGYDKAEPVFAENGLEVDVARCCANRANLLQEMGRYQEALAGYDKAEPVFAEHGLVVDVVRCQMNRAIVMQLMGRYQEAMVVYELLDSSFLSSENLWRYHRGFGKALWIGGRKEEALEQLTQGRRTLLHARQTAGIDETSLEFVEERNVLIKESVGYALEADQISMAFEAVQDGKAGILGDLRQRDGHDPVAMTGETLSARAALCNALRQTKKEKDEKSIRELTGHYLKLWHMDQAGSQEFQQSRTPSYRNKEEIVSLEQIQGVLPTNWALLDFWVLDREHVKVFVVTRGKLQVKTLSVSLQDTDVQNALYDLTNWLTTGQGERDYALDLFYDRLFAPLMPLLRGVKGLYLVPHRYLHLIPLHACCIEEGRYICDEFAMAYLPSSSLLPQLPPLDLNDKMLTLANPDRQTPNTLPFSEWEAEEIQRRLKLPQHQVWIGAEATLEKTKVWQEIPLVHFSCHGFGNYIFSPISHLRLADDLLLAHDIVNQALPLPDGALAILNGCQTGVRD